VITKTFQPFLKPGQEVPQALVSDLLKRFSTGEGYALYSDVMPFFQMLRSTRHKVDIAHDWNWDRTIIGIITNSDSRVPGILESLGLKVEPRRFGSTAQLRKEASLGGDISFVVLSYDVGYEKPDAHIFDAATEMLKEMLTDYGGKPGELSVDDFERLYVGDSLEKDYFGAARAGWHVVYLDRQHQNDNLKDSPVGRTALKTITEDGKTEDGKAVETQVYSIGDLEALSGWSPAHKEADARS
jgi:FMN phosphatase YigB (HAD superfamily)